MRLPIVIPLARIVYHGFILSQINDWSLVILGNKRIFKRSWVKFPTKNADTAYQTVKATYLKLKLIELLYKNVITPIWEQTCSAT